MGFGAPAPSSGTRNISNVGPYNEIVHGQTITYNNYLAPNWAPPTEQQSLVRLLPPATAS